MKTTDTKELSDFKAHDRILGGLMVVVLICEPAACWTCWGASDHG
jgi:hypothetical protein